MPQRMNWALKPLTTIDRALDKHALKKTSLRRSILLAFSQSKTSLSQADLIETLEQKLKTVDRVSIYRNLIQLKDIGILHEVDANRYVFCAHDCEAHAHLLLYCQQCHRHQEIKDHTRIDGFLSAIGGFRFFGKKRPIFLRGGCSNCN